MRRIPACLLLAAIAATATSSGTLGPKTAAATTSCQPGDVEIALSGLAFSPGVKTVADGTTICWTNRDAVTHTVTSDSAAFDSTDLTQNATFRFTFPSDGAFAYHCKYHHFMTGTIYVGS